MLLIYISHSLIRKAYLEIALIYIHMSNLDTNKNTITLRTTKTPETPTSKGKVILEYNICYHY